MFLLLDLHIHTNYSLDSRIKPWTLLKIAKDLGIGVAITDHNTMKGVQAVQRLTRKEKEWEDVLVIPGEEVHTDRGDLIGLFVEEEIRSRELHHVSDEIREQGGIVVAPHPFDITRGSSIQPTLEMAHIFDLVECFNARCTSTSANREALAYAKTTGLGVCGGSDAHTPGEIGAGLTEVDANTEEEVYQKLRCGNPGTKVYGKLSPPHVRMISAFTKIGRRLTGGLWEG